MIAAALVKTRGVSPVKTRLAASIGREKAEEFFRLSVDCTRELLLALQSQLSVEPVWAVAEPDQLTASVWQGIRTIGQGKGQLGDRLAHVSSHLWAHDRQGPHFLLGADSPQLTVEMIRAAFDVAKGSGKVWVGPAQDGGYYLAATDIEVSAEVWTSIPYSSDRTGQAFVDALGDRGQFFGPKVRDVDDLEDLRELRSTLQRLEVPTEAQSRLLAWIIESDF